MADATYLALRVLKMSTKLHPSVKWVAFELGILDQGDGAFASAATLAERLGLGIDTVKRARAHLLALGLLRCDRAHRRTGTWFVTLPAFELPDRPTVHQMRAARQLLDVYLVHKLSTMDAPAPPFGSERMDAPSPPFEPGVIHNGGMGAPRMGAPVPPKEGLEEQRKQEPQDLPIHKEDGQLPDTWRAMKSKLHPREVA